MLQEEKIENSEISLKIVTGLWRDHKEVRFAWGLLQCCGEGEESVVV